MTPTEAIVLLRELLSYIDVCDDDKSIDAFFTEDNRKRLTEAVETLSDIAELSQKKLKGLANSTLSSNCQEHGRFTSIVSSDGSYHSECPECYKERDRWHALPWWKRMFTPYPD